MSIVLAEIDSTCSYLGSFVDDEYKITSDSISCLKHLIWFLRHDGDTHEYRRHIGQSKILQKDLLPMLVSNSDNLDLSHVLLRLLVNLSYPALLLYREELPKDGPGRRNFLEIIEILQSYKEAFASKQVWVILGVYLQKVLEIDVALRADSDSLLIERVLSLIRNILQVPVNPSTENRADNDASVHDQVLWSLQQSGVLDLILYILASEFENVYHLHALEIIYLVYREQTPESLANALMQRSETEKQQDEQELISILRREKEEKLKQIPNSRHSRFGGCYVLKDVKSISENDLISHQPIDKAYKMEFDREKNRKKKSHRIVKEENVVHRRSAFSIRLFLREFCLEILHSAFNNFVASIRATVQRETSGGHDDSYLLWAMSFFMEFNRLSNFRLELISESLSLTSFHWVLTRIQFNMDMITSDKKNSRLWSRRLHLAIKAYRELLYSLNTLQKFKDDDKSQGLYRMIQNNIFYVLEHRETMLHLIINYKEANSTKAYLRDVIETAHTFFKMMEKFSAGGIVVQQKKRRKNKPNSQKNDNRKNNDNDEQEENDNEQLENKWAHLMTQLSIVLSNENLKLPGDNEIVPFDATSDKSIDDQKEDCMLKIYEYLKEEQYEHAVCMLRAGREVWMEDDCFGSFTSAPEDELMILKEIFFSNLSYKKGFICSMNDHTAKKECSSNNKLQPNSNIVDERRKINESIQLY